MAFKAVAKITPQYEDNPNWWLKAYEQGTTTPLAMATDKTGATQLAKAELNLDGYPITAGNAMFIPFINGDYDLWLFPTEAEADANDTSNALKYADDENTDDTSNLVEDSLTRLFDNVAAMVAATDIISGQTVGTRGYTAAGDPGAATYLSESGTGDGFGDHTSSGVVGLVFTLQPSNGVVSGYQFGMIESTDSTLAYNAAVTYITTNSLTLDLLGKSYTYNIAVSATANTIDGFDSWKIINGTLNRTSTFALGETAIIHVVLNCDHWAIDLSVTGPTTVFGGGSIGTETNKGYFAVSVSGSCEDFSVDLNVSDNYMGLLTGGGPSTTADKSIKNWKANVVILNNQYGVNCANRGDNALVKVSSTKSHRPYFVYGVDDHDIDIRSDVPGTVSSLITTYDSDTTNIRGSVSILYSGDVDSRATLNGGLDITTTGTLSALGKIDGIDLKLFARSSGVFGPNNYRPVLGFDSNTVSQRIQNVNIETDIEGWEGNDFRAPIGYIEQTGYDGSGLPVFTAGSVEPIFDNINIHGRCIANAATTNNIELTSSLAEGKFTYRLDGSGFMKVVNLSSDASARIQVERSTLKNVSGGSGASIDYGFMSESLNTWIGKSYNESIGAVTLPNQAEYQREDTTSFTTSSGQVSPVVVPVKEVQPVNFKKYRLQGFSNTSVFDGVLQVRVAAGVLDSASTMLSFQSTLNGAAIGGGNITITGIAVVGGEMQITFTSPVDADLDFMSFTLRPYGEIGSF